MPENGRRDLIRRLKVKSTEAYFRLAHHTEYTLHYDLLLLCEAAFVKVNVLTKSE